MSMSALLLATRDQLRQTLGLSADDCKVMASGQPTPISGETFFAVHYGYWRDGGSKGQCLQEVFGVNVTVSVRAPKLPFDRHGEELIVLAGTGLVDLCRKVVAAIHMDPADSTTNAVMWRANEIIGTGASGFEEPLQFQDGGQPIPQSGKWFGADGKETLAGYAQTIAFGGAVRVQTIETQT